jgi:hypothetical protein
MQRRGHPSVNAAEQIEKAGVRGTSQISWRGGRFEQAQADHGGKKHLRVVLR